MATSNARKFLIGAFTALLTTGAVVSGCSDDNASSAPAEAGATCPATFDGANGAKCVAEGQRCSYEYYCTGNLYQVTNCSCTAGKFACYDQTAPTTPIVVGSPPGCLQPKPTTPNCPSTFQSAEGQACTVAGAVCYYPGQLCDGIQNLDHCQCVAGGNGSASDGGNLAFKCERDICNLEAGISYPDSSIYSDASTDADDGG
jgi:hypothetical protein